MEGHLRTATVIAHMLDNQFHFFGRRFGINSIIGLLPGFGDVVATLLSLYIIWIGLEMGVSRLRIIEMIGNVMINFVIGLIPVVGDAVYFLRKPNLKNVQILQNHAKNHVIEGEVVHPLQPATFR